MTIKIDKELAERILNEEAKAAIEPAYPDRVKEAAQPDWEVLIEELSLTCASKNRTHIAFLGTALLAKATNVKADSFAVKAKATTPGAYSARSLGHGVLVPNAPLLGFSIGPTGREPLNNQPYFRIQRATLGEVLPLVKGSARPAVQQLCAILEELEACTSETEARRALRAFIKVRRRYLPTYSTAPSSRAKISESAFVTLVSSLVGTDSEGGKRAQAVAAGLLDLFAGQDRVEGGRVNDPDRHIPGDVGVRTLAEKPEWERVLEVRDKLVRSSDLVSFAQKCAESGVHKAAVLAVSADQTKIDTSQVRQWAEPRGVTITVFVGWGDFIRQVFHWGQKSVAVSLEEAAVHIRKRLIEVEASSDAVEAWDRGVSEDDKGDSGQ